MQTTNEAIQALRQQWGEELLILGHHYQDAAIIPYCDAVGDSLELSRIAAASKAKRIVFCGVRFMAETADVLSRSLDGHDNGRRVYQPAPAAGCPMADMATAEALEKAWAQITAATPGVEWVPIVYVNSSADVKAFCGRHGGAACTSGNGHHIVKHFLDQGKRILFAPDQHLCTNILRELGYPATAVRLWQRESPDGGLTQEDLQAATLVAWNGCCPIHAGYTLDDLQHARERLPQAKLLIHPEAPSPVAAQADKTGSTKAIIDAVKAAAAGERLLIGTEDHLVQRLKAAYPALTIEPIRPILCRDMGLTTPEQLLRVLQSWPEETLVRVDDSLVPDARICVQRMLEI